MLQTFHIHVISGCLSTRNVSKLMQLSVLVVRLVQRVIEGGKLPQLCYALWLYIHFV